jgi:hypothetical protein
VGAVTKVYVPEGISVPQPRTKQFFYPDAVIHNKVLIFFAHVVCGKKSGGVRKKMTHADDWEPVRYRDLPDWVKEDSKPRRWVRNTYKTVFYGDPYDYLVQYTVEGGTLTLSYWKTAHTYQREKKPAKKIPLPSIRILYGVIIFVAAAAVLLFLSPFLSSLSVPSLAISPPAVTSEVPVLPSPTPAPQSPTPLVTTVSEADYLRSPKTTSFSYFIEGNRRSLSFTTFGGLSDFFSGKSHSFYYDPDNGVIMDLLENRVQNEFMLPFIDMIRKRSTTSDDQAKIAISLVQRIPNNGNRYVRTQTDWYYPYEILHNNEGSAADKSILLAYILNELGYETVLFEFPGHMAVGVKASSRYSFYDTGYAYIETTRPTIITYEPDPGYGGFSIAQNPRVIHLSGGRRALDVSTEYSDARRMKQLEAMGGSLNQSYRAELSKISDTYDLD